MGVYPSYPGGVAPVRACSARPTSSFRIASLSTPYSIAWRTPSLPKAPPEFGNKD